jgi:hypothetical protein
MVPSAKSKLAQVKRLIRKDNIKIRSLDRVSTDFDHMYQFQYWSASN